MSFREAGPWAGLFTSVGQVHPTVSWVKWTLHRAMDKQPSPPQPPRHSPATSPLVCAPLTVCVFLLLCSHTDLHCLWLEGAEKGSASSSQLSSDPRGLHNCLLMNQMLASRDVASSILPLALDLSLKDIYFAPALVKYVLYSTSTPCSPNSEPRKSHIKFHIKFLAI